MFTEELLFVNDNTFNKINLYYAPLTLPVSII